VPAIKLESIEWKNQAPYAPGQKDENREVTIVRGAITLSQTEPRKVLGLFDNFVEALHGQPACPSPCSNALRHRTGQCTAWRRRH
jgi:hypothetical protein